MTNDQEDEAVVKLMEDCAHKLAEHCSSVRVVATVYHGDSERTHIVTRGMGDFYAQMGAVRFWLKQEEKEE